MKILKFVVTGGPCGGKTTALKKIKSALESNGFNVLICPETASELICGGITADKIGVLNLQKLIFKMQIEKESAYATAAALLNNTTVILYDRGLIDGNAYISNSEFNGILEEFNQTKDNIIKRYNAVFHFVTTADGAEEYYTLANNFARSEDIATARHIDKKTSNAWILHPSFHRYDNSADFESKINNCINDMIEFIKNH